jgi:3-oxoacyl-[acyl-carrier protein] reductase
MVEQRVALVTGGSRGIGRGICLELARRGFAVAVNYAGNEAAARETQKLIEEGNTRGADAPRSPMLCRGDVAVAADRERLVDQILAEWGRIDLLVNNAGITSIGRRDILEATEESWDRVLAVNLKGPYFLTQRIAREMIRTVKDEGGRMKDESDKPGSSFILPLSSFRCVINITSLSTYSVSTNRGDYCISKAGLSMMTKLWAVRLAEFGIHVYEIRPGVIETDMTAGAKEHYDRLIAEGLSPIRRWGTPADVGRAVGALASGELAFSTGDAINVDGGFHIRRL